MGTKEVQVICRQCGKSIDKSKAYLDDKRKSFYFCDVFCAIEYDKSKKINQKIKKKENKQTDKNRTERKKSDREELFDYISSLYGYFPKFMPQKVKQLTDDGMTYKGIELALRYWVETLNHGWGEESGVGIVPYIYEDAKEFWNKKQSIKKKSTEIPKDNVIVNKNTSKNLSLLKYKIRNK